MTARRGRHVATHTLVVVHPIEHDGLDMTVRELRAEAERELPDLLFDLHAVVCGVPTWKVEPFRQSTTGQALVMRAAAREWPKPLARLDVRTPPA